MDLNELYKEIEKAEIDLNAKRLKYIKEALVENGGSIKLKFKKWGEDNNAFDFDDQFPVIIEIAGIPMFLTEVYVKKNGFRMVLLDYDDIVKLSVIGCNSFDFCIGRLVFCYRKST